MSQSNDAAPTARVLVIDDEPQIRKFIDISLRSQGYATLLAETGQEGLALLASKGADIVVLDLGLPDRDGKDVLKELRQWSRAPVIVLTVRSGEEEKVALLDAGANDYVTKPFGIGELVARIRVALRHAVRARDGERVLALEDATIDLDRRRALRGDAEVRLTPIEFHLIAALAKHAGSVVTHRQLLREVWGPTHENDTHYLRIYVKQLRDKLEVDPANPRHFVTELAVGYRLELDD